MPTVPQAPDEMLPQALPGPRASTDAANITAFGGYDRFTPNPFHAAQGLSEDVIQMAEQERAKADDVATTAAHTQLLNLKNTLLYDPQNGAYTKKGQDAFSVPDVYGQKFQDGADEIGNGLHNDQQKAVFDKMRQTYSAEFHGEIDRHVFQQAQQFDKDTFSNGLEAAQKDAVLNYQNPGKVDQSIAVQQSLLDSFASRNGIAPTSDQYKNMQSDIASKTHEGVISRMIDNGQDAVAKNYFDSVKDDLNTPTLLHTEKLVEEGSLRGQSQRLVDSMMDRNLSATDAMSEMRDISEPKLRDEVSARYRSQLAEQKALQSDQQNQQFQQLAQTVEQTKNTDSIPRDQWLSLTLSDREALDKRADQLRRGVQPETNWNEYYNLKTQAADPKLQNDFMKENLMKYRTDMADTQFNELINLQTSLHKQDGKADPLLNGFTTNQEVVNDSLKAMGVNPTAKPGSDGATQVNQFRQMVDQQIINHQQTTGKKASTQEVQGIVDTLSQKVIKDRGWFWNTNARVYELPPGSNFEVDPKEIPRSDRIQIEDALKRNNLPVTDKSVTDLYQRKLQGTVNGGK